LADVRSTAGLSRVLATILVCVCLAGCGGNTAVRGQFGSGAPVSGQGFYASGNGTLAAALIVVAMLADGLGWASAKLNHALADPLPTEGVGRYACVR